ncbi:MAG: insulinase family protein [Bacteroidaceae bacterium]|nr:insulinase family protein [Bacteroidaceae bacterium]
MGLRRGTLPNGLTYYVRRSTVPEHSVSIALVVRAGALVEEDNQRGIAHFIEHICFDGTTHYPASSLDSYLQSLGLKVGADYNASTSITNTCFHISNIPSQRKSAVDSCLLALSDWAGGLQFSRKSVNKERRIIREEWRASVGARTRMYASCLPHVYGGSRHGFRLPIGLMSVVDTVTVEGLREFYNRWYVPNNQCVIVVGDIDVDKTVATIAQLFSNRPISSLDEAPLQFDIPDNAEPIITVASDKEQRNMSFLLSRKIVPFPRSARDSEEYLRCEYARSMAGYMLSARMAEMSSGSSSPFLRIESEYTDFMLSKARMSMRTSFLASADKWKAAFRDAYREILRARKFGFTQSELNRIKSDYEAMFMSRRKESGGKSSANWISDCIDNYLYGDPVMDAESDSRICLSLLPSLSLDYVNGVAKSALADSNWVFSAFTPFVHDSVRPSPQLIAQLVKEVESEVLFPYSDVAIEDSLLDMSSDGGYVVRIDDGAFGSQVVTMSNGVKVVIKPTDFKNDEIRMVSFRRKGLNSFAESDAVNVRVMHGMITNSGWGGLSNIELARRLSGRQVASQVYANEYRSGVSGHSSVDDFESMLRLTYMKLTSPNTAPSLFDAYRRQLKERIHNSHFDVERCFADSVNSALYGTNYKDSRISEAEVDAVDNDRVVDIYRSLYSDAAGATFVFVGNIDVERHLPLILKYIGGLPSVETTVADNANMTYVAQGQRSLQFTAPMEEPHVVTEINYSMRMPYSFQASLMCDVMAQVVERVLTRQMRETKGGIYDVMVDCSVSLQSEVVMSVYFKSSVANHKSLLKTVYSVLNDIAANGPDESDFTSVRDFLVRYENSRLRSNHTLLDVIDSYYWYNLEGEPSASEVLRSMKSDIFCDFAAKLLKSGNRVEVVMKPY